MEATTFAARLRQLADERHELQALLIANGVRPLPSWSIRAAREKARRRGLIPEGGTDG